MSTDPTGTGGLEGAEKDLADLAIRKGYLTRRQLAVALSTRAAAEPDTPLDVMLLSLGFLEEDQVEDLLREIRPPAPPKPRPPARPRKPIVVPEGAEVRIVGPATLLEPVGRGPSGRVYRAFHGDRGEEVAVKEIPANDLNRPFLERFRERSRRLIGVEHPHIARLFEVLERPEGLYLISEWVEGVTLQEHLRQVPMLEVSQAIRILRQVGEALQAAHRAGAVHGNLKAENVLLGDDLEVKLTDFGLGRDDPEFLKDHADLAGSILHVLAPEQWRREAEPATDLYACGVLWHFMLTGRFPFTGKGYQVTRQNHELGLAAPPSEFRPDLPPAADTLFRLLANKDVKGRYPGTRAFLLDLRHLELGFPLRGLPATVRPRRPAAEAAPLRRKEAAAGGRTSSRRGRTPPRDKEGGASRRSR